MLRASAGNPPLVFEFSVRARPNELERSFLEVPWEIPADGSVFLASIPYLLYSPVRRIGEKSKTEDPSKYRLSLVFMAADPRGNTPLQYELEESAILEATGSIGLDLTVEESGMLPFLADCMAREAPVDVLHISCHGTAGPEPALILEDEVGDKSPASAGDLVKELAINKPRLLFLSACMSSGPVSAAGKNSDTISLVGSLSSSLISRGIPAVLGWGGSVGDDEATRFAARFYGCLAKKSNIEEALALARLSLLDPGDKAGPARRSDDWHLARLCLGPTGGGVLCTGGMARKPSGIESGYREFLNAKDKKIPVAGRREFVGRRRPIQDILRQFRDRESRYAGVLIHGFGRQGKSSLAARIANRMSEHQVVVVYKNYDAVSILDAMAHLTGSAEVRKIVERYREEAGRSAGSLYFALRELLQGPCCQVEKDREGRTLRRPVLLVVDDFERALSDPVPGELHGVGEDLVEPVRALIEAFEAGGTDSKLLITSRCKFSLPGKSRDLAESLFFVHLPPMAEYEGKKQAWAREKLIKAGSVPDPARTVRCVRAALGNPGLQDLLFSMAVNTPDTCDRALKDMEAYIESGEEPDQERISEFLKNLTIGHILGLLSENEREILRASTLFEIPVPLETLSLMITNFGLGGGEQPGSRLLGLGIWEVYEDLFNPQAVAVAVNALVRPKAGELSEEEKIALAETLAGDLFKRWGGREGKKRPYPAAHELTRLALMAKDTTVVASTAQDAIEWLDQRFLYRDAAELARKCVALLDEANAEVPLQLLRRACECCNQVGDIGSARRFIGRAVEALDSAGKCADTLGDGDFASVLITQARLLVQDGFPDRALSVFRKAENLLQSERFLRERSIVLGDIARIKAGKGEVDEALKLHEEVLSVCNELGDRRERSVTLLDLAQIELSRELFREAFEDLVESYDIAESLGALDGMSVVGAYLGQILCRENQKDKGMAMLIRSREGFKKLGREHMADQVDELIRDFQP